MRQATYWWCQPSMRQMSFVIYKWDTKQNLVIVRSPFWAKHHVVVQCMARWMKCPLSPSPPPPPGMDPPPGPPWQGEHGRIDDITGKGLCTAVALSTASCFSYKGQSDVVYVMWYPHVSQASRGLSSIDSSRSRGQGTSPPPTKIFTHPPWKGCKRMSSLFHAPAGLDLFFDQKVWSATPAPSFTWFLVPQEKSPIDHRSFSFV